MAVSVVPCAVIRIMGSRGLAACNSRTRSSPLGPGNLKSVRTTSNGSAPARASPVSPRFSTATAWPSPSSSRVNVTVMPGSSSMSRIFVFMVCDARQNDAKRGAVVHLRLILQRAAVLFNYARRDGQAQAGAAFLGGEEWVKQAFLRARRDAFAGVGDFKNDNLSVARGQALAVESRPQGHDAVVPDGVGGVLHEVDKDLLDLLRVDANP